MTYFINKKRYPKSVQWAVDNKTKEYMWALPGPYLRKSLLRSLARRVSDHYLPEALYQKTTFSVLPYAKSKGEQDEQIYTTTLSNKIVLYSKGAEEEAEVSESDDDDEED
jgi:hypothetical protein